MNVLMLYPKFPEQTFWNTARSIKLLWGRKAIMPPLGLLTIASYLSFIFDCAVFHHLHQHAEYVQREIGRYLAAPNSDDVPDEVINCRGSLGQETAPRQAS
jgi:hypothetical protein